MIDEFSPYSPNETTFDPRFVGPTGAKEDVDAYMVGEALGREEAEQGMPFVGRAGRLLRERPLT
jgi:uracil-DNA glycosylase family 4